MKITKDLLIQHRACSKALRFVKNLLPVSISPDPEENIDLAIKLIAIYEHKSTCETKDCLSCCRNLLQDLEWLTCNINEPGYMDVLALKDMCHTGFGASNKLLLVMQMLAIIADKEIGEK